MSRPRTTVYPGSGAPASGSYALPSRHSVVVDHASRRREKRPGRPPRPASRHRAAGERRKDDLARTQLRRPSFGPSKRSRAISGIRRAGKESAAAAPLGFFHGRTGYCVLAVAVDDVQYHAMLLRARELRRVVEELGSLSTPAIHAGVDARLRGSEKNVELPPGQRELVEEIVEILERPGLSPMQARALAHAFRSE